MNFRNAARDRKFPCFSESESEWRGPFYFIQAADPQFGMIEAFKPEISEPGWEEELELTQRLIHKVNHMKPPPKFLVVCGDLVHSMPGGKRAHDTPEMIAAQNEDVKKVFSELNPEIPLVCLCGNHDIGSNPTMEWINDYRRQYGDDYFSFWCGGVFFICLNSQFYENCERVTDYAAEQEEWLESQLSLINGNRAVIFQHHPWFLENYNEPDKYFNIRKDLRLYMLQKFHKSGVSAIFNGHYHRNAGGCYKDMEVITTSAVGAQLGDDGHGARIVKVYKTGVKHQYYVINDIPEVVDLQGH